MTRHKRTGPLSVAMREDLGRLVARESVHALARRWAVGTPTINRAVRGEGLTPALARYLATCIAQETYCTPERPAA